MSRLTRIRKNRRHAEVNWKYNRNSEKYAGLMLFMKKCAIDQERYTAYKWRVQRPIDRFLKKHGDEVNFSFEILQDNKWILVKAVPREYGTKYIIWDPVEIRKTPPDSDDVIRNLKIIKQQ